MLCYFIVYCKKCTGCKVADFPNASTYDKVPFEVIDWLGLERFLKMTLEIFSCSILYSISVMLALEENASETIISRKNTNHVFR